MDTGDGVELCRDGTVFTVRTEACRYRSGERDWRISLKRTPHGFFLAGCTIRDESPEDRLKYEFEIPWELANSMLDELMTIRVPAAPVFDMGQDGEFIELTVGGYEGKAHYRWWSEPPKGWGPLAAFARRVMDVFYGLLPRE